MVAFGTIRKLITRKLISRIGAARETGLLVLGGVLVGSLGWSLTGCTSYTNVPGPDNPVTRQDPNAMQASAATETALAWAVRRHGVAGPYAINLPVGTSRETADRIAAALGPDARVPEDSAAGLPTFHVTRVWIRISDAKVDVVYPMTTYDGRDVERGVTVWMHAGVRPWTVSRGQYWAPGTIPTPPIWVPIPAAELKARERAASKRGDAAGEEDQEPGQPGAGQAVPEPSEPDTVESSSGEPDAGVVDGGGGY